MLKKTGGSTFKKELALCLVLILMGFLDWITTVLGVLYFRAVETNPLFAGIIDSNILIFSCVKLFTAVFIGLLFYKGYAIEKTSGTNSNFGKRFLQSGYLISLMTLTFVVTNNMVAVARVL